MARPVMLKQRLDEDRAMGLRRCCECGAYSEPYYLSCPRCKGDFPDHTETCPTCENAKLPDEDGCATCLMLWQASPKPIAISN